MKKLVLLLIATLFLLTACFGGQAKERVAVNGPTQQKASQPNPVAQVQPPSDIDTSVNTTATPPSQNSENTSKTDAADSQYCTSHMKIMWGETVWSEDGGKSGFNFWSEGGKYLPDLIMCGWDINAPDPKGVYPLINALEIKNPDVLRAFMNYNPSLDIKDSQGHDLYNIALALKTAPSDILERLKSRLSREQQKHDEDVVQMTMHGSTLSIDDLQRFVSSGINLNEDMNPYSSYSVDYRVENGIISDLDWETGTILGSAVKHQDLPKVKWLLEHGANANQFLGSGEFHCSPLKYALTSNLSIAELLLQHGANPNEKIWLYPGKATLSAYYACDPKISGLMQKYGGTEWYYEAEGNNQMRTYSKEEILNHCKDTSSSASGNSQ